MELAIILKIIICHWIGDGLLQTEKMATQKSKSIYWLSAHVGAYILPFIVVFYNILGWVLLMAILHWIQDFITSRLNTHYLKTKNNSMFWNSIWTDQMIHYVIMFVSITYFI